MAIRRCPYCKAIIDEQDQYCNNCGTQLLFPEDESVEEEIPGDKIIDEDDESAPPDEEFRTEEEEGEGDEEEDDEEDEEDKDDNEVGVKEDEEEDEEEEDEDDLAGREETREEEEIELREEREQEALEQDRTRDQESEELGAGAGEEAEEDESEELEYIGKDTGKFEAPPQQTQEDTFTERPATGEVIEAEEEEGQEDKELQSWMELKEEIARKARGAEAEKEEEETAGPARGKKYEASIEQDELVFKTKDLDKLRGTAEEDTKARGGFLFSLEDKRAEEEGPVPETKEVLPPWASQIRETPSPAAGGDETGTPAEKSGPPGRDWTADSGVGMPERVTQTTLPLAGALAQEREADTQDQEEEREEKREEATEEERVEETADETRARFRLGLSLKLKAKLVDVVFITALWLISLWFTAWVIGASFFKIIFAAPLPVFVFYLILLGLYFFLFLYFLGETLGDHYFSGEE
jgi:hypothetical protein